VEGGFECGGAADPGFAGSNTSGLKTALAFWLLVEKFLAEAVVTASAARSAVAASAATRNCLV